MKATTQSSQWARAWQRQRPVPQRPSIVSMFFGNNNEQGGFINIKLVFSLIYLEVRPSHVISFPESIAEEYYKSIYNDLHICKRDTAMIVPPHTKAVDDVMVS